MKKIAIFGASGHGKVVADLAELCGFEVVFFDDSFPQKNRIEHWLVIGTFDELIKRQDEFEYSIVAIGDNRVRNEKSCHLESEGFNLPVLIHPSAIVSRYAEIALGSVILANTVINAFARIGKNCIINSAVVVEHDCQLGDGVHLSPKVALAGGTIVQDLVWIGIGSVTRQLTRVGKNSIIGANSSVITNIPPNVIAFGSPAKIKEFN